ncbi:putative translation factor [Oryzomicrobium terrae]|uniref:Threonylcarbamoyl-AMP synthase n=1 Tax=Oryzomicrobium terrae TaxID=1735038 RepID=A0A5C1ECZ2_9RHOO|nr:L-threonylcarbamoyladenylate synthase [Oryzomicrobium terrae]QEL66037.1 putative translation factor [Oryzomicrobium terrae]
MPDTPASPSVPASEIERAVTLLKAGELVAFPTETVYGLGADAANPAAVAKIFAVKGRPADHPVIVHLPCSQSMEDWARDIPAVAWELAEYFWPGPLTLILKRQPYVPDAVTGGQDTVGLRVPGHPVALALLQAFSRAGGSGGVAGPSANRFGRISPTAASHVCDELGDRVAMVLDGGECPVGIESTIVDLSSGTPRLLRPGHIRPDQLEAVMGEPLALPAHLRNTEVPRVSGALAAHYAPRTHMTLVESAGLDVEIFRAGYQSMAVYAWSRSAPVELPANIIWVSAPTTPSAYAHELYAALRHLDELGVAQLLVESPPRGALWAAIHDRLDRAACGAGLGADQT